MLKLGLISRTLESEDLNLSIGGNIAFNRTKIKNLGLPPSDVLINGKVEQRAYYLGQAISRGNIFKHPANAFIDGEESALFWGWKTDGVFKEGDQMYPIDNVMSEPGDLKIVDTNGDGAVDKLDETIIEIRQILYMDLILTSYKNLSLSMLFNGVEGNQIANGGRYQLGATMAEGGNFTRNVMSDAYFKTWSPENPNTTYQKLVIKNTLIDSH